MLLYEKKSDGTKGVYGTLGQIPGNDDELLIESEELRYKKWFNDGNGGIKDASGKEIIVTVDDKVIIPTDGEVPEPIGPVEPESKASIDATTESFAEYFENNVYNKKGSGNYINRANDEDVAKHFYVKVAKNVSSTLADQVSIGDIDVSEDFSLSVGSNSFVKDVPYYIRNNELFVAFPLIIFEGDIRVGDEVIYTGSPSSTLTVNNASIVGNGGSTVETKNNEFIAVMKSREDYIFYDINSVAADDILITKKINSYTFDDSTTSTATSYGFTTADEVSSKFGVWIYPFGYASDTSEWNAKARTGQLTYDIHVVNKGTAHAVTQLTREDME